VKIQQVHFAFNNPGLIKRLWDRVSEFCRRYESESDREILFEEMMANYFNSNPRMLMFVCLDDEENIVGHLIATIDEYYGSKFITIHQYWKDPGIKIPDNLKAEVFIALGRWGELCGTDKVRVWARNSTVANLFEKYGFERDKKIIMNASIKDVANRLAELQPNEENGEPAWAEAAGETPKPALHRM